MSTPAEHHEDIQWRARYLGDWKPVALGTRESWVPDAVVAQDGSGTHRSVQAALNDLPPAGRTGAGVRRIFIKPGTYAELVCLRSRAPVVLYGLGDPRHTVITGAQYAGQRKAVGSAPHPCLEGDASDNVGTFGSSTMIVRSSDVSIVGLTVANTAMMAVRHGEAYPPGAGESGGAQGVALSLRGDRIRLHQVRLVGHQDTLLADWRSGDPLHRVHVTESLIAGDVDFIFGAARLVIEDSTIVSLSGRRKPGNAGYVLAPSTPHDQAFGFLVQRSRLLGQAGLAPGSIHLGRPWDMGVPRGQWVAGQSPNGQALIRRSELGPHLQRAWGRSTAWRLPEATGPQAFRMAETDNRATQAWAPEVLP